ncbi:hypothetical protein Ciccas_010968 [Cichlidogyrus casuarinus]|uniref:Uncharacterized protein n=1 Tax=Cichlidogyrus casuarinus TaxID=1844966 RepID=A0ABD2PTQ9_9PLAT
MKSSRPNVSDIVDSIKKKIKLSSGHSQEFTWDCNCAVCEKLVGVVINFVKWLQDIGPNLCKAMKNLKDKCAKNNDETVTTLLAEISILIRLVTEYKKNFDKLEHLNHSALPEICTKAITLFIRIIEFNISLESIDLETHGYLEEYATGMNAIVMSIVGDSQEIIRDLLRDAPEDDLKQSLQGLIKNSTKLHREDSDCIHCSLFTKLVDMVTLALRECETNISKHLTEQDENMNTRAILFKVESTLEHVKSFVGIPLGDRILCSKSYLRDLIVELCLLIEEACHKSKLTDEAFTKLFEKDHDESGLSDESKSLIILLFSLITAAFHKVFDLLLSNNGEFIFLH